MLMAIAGVLLVAWAVGVGIFDVGKGGHVLLLVGLMLLLLGFLKARDAAALSARANEPSDPNK